MHICGESLLFCPLVESLHWQLCSILRQVSATDTCCVCTQIPTQLSFVGFNSGSPHHVGILASLTSSGLGRICTWCTVSPSAFVPVVSLAWGAPECTGSHFRSSESLRIPTWPFLTTTFDYALLQPTPLSSLNADFLSQLHLAFE